MTTSLSRVVGDNPASEVYIGSKKKVMVEAGMRSFDHRLPGMASEAELLALIAGSTTTQQCMAFWSSFPCPRRSILTR
jgi:methylenetetrahydrofolate dehydrogenase (NADP+) / methenyltetrahydrofolate cyclohydrolase